MIVQLQPQLHGTGRLDELTQRGDLSAPAKTTVRHTTSNAELKAFHQREEKALLGNRHISWKRVAKSGDASFIGVGINLQAAAYPPEVAIRATAIESELGRAIDPELVLAGVLEQLSDRLALLERSPGDILQAWRAASPNAIGTRVEWDGRHGLTAGIDDSGALLIRTSAGLERIIAGELHWHLGT